MKNFIEKYKMLFRAGRKLIIIASILIIGLTLIADRATPATTSNDQTDHATQPTAVAATGAQNTARRSQKTFEVIKIIDGDTIDVVIDGATERIRLIGINTPETADPRKSVKCFGVEASNKAKSLLESARITLKNDPSQGERDKYNRLLRYIFLEDGTNFNLLMIKEGYAHEYTYRVPYQYQAEFKRAQKEAVANKVGLWGNRCPTL